MNCPSAQMHKLKGNGGATENRLGVGLFLWNARPHCMMVIDTDTV